MKSISATIVLGAIGTALANYFFYKGEGATHAQIVGTEILRGAGDEDIHCKNVELNKNGIILIGLYNKFGRVRTIIRKYIYKILTMGLLKHFPRSHLMLIFLYFLYPVDLHVLYNNNQIVYL